MDLLEDSLPDQGEFERISSPVTATSDEPSLILTFRAVLRPGQMQALSSVLADPKACQRLLT